MFKGKIISDKLILILESVKQIEQYTIPIKTADDFLLSPEGMLRLDACVMRLQVIGESVRSILAVDDNPLSSCDKIPWKKIIGLRNIISHEYMSVDEVLIFNIINKELPYLKTTVEGILSEWKL